MAGSQLNRNFDEDADVIPKILIHVLLNACELSSLGGDFFNTSHRPVHVKRKMGRLIGRVAAHVCRVIRKCRQSFSFNTRATRVT